MRASGSCPRFVGLAAAIASAAVLATACGARQAPPTGTVHQPPAVDSRAGATAYARRLLTSMHLPSGARKLRWPTRPPAGLTPATPGIGSDMVDLTVLYRLSQPMSTTYRFLAAHHPDGTANGGYAQSSVHGTLTSEVADFTPVSLPVGIFSAALNTAIEPGPGDGSVLRADAFVAWYPPRGTARPINAAGYRAVIIRWHHGYSVTARTLTSRQAVLHFAGLYNGLYGAPQIDTRCPLTGTGPDTYSYQVEFSPAPGQPAVVLTPVCLLVKVSIGGRQVAALYPATALRGAAAMAVAARTD